MAVLDVGCGPGRLTIPVAKQVGPTGYVVAIDIQSGMLDRARFRVEQSGLDNVQFRQVAVGEGQAKLAQAEFDRVVLVTVLGEIPNRETALKEIYAAVKPGGILSVTEIIFDPHFQSRRTVLRFAEAAGFRESAFYGNRVAYTLNLEKPG
jgi:ubiquinone/menaquinone biosynthesis C-methylase UbiE